MEKRKRWQFYLIVGVIILMVYNILPTVFYYSKPLKKPVDSELAQKVSIQISDRVNDLEEDAVSWVNAFSKNLGLTPVAIQSSKEDSRFIEVTFNQAKDAATFKKFLPRAGSLIPFVPAQVGLGPDTQESDKKVLVERKIYVHFQPDQTSKYFQFSPKRTSAGEIAPFYQFITFDRVVQLGLALGGTSEQARVLEAALDPDVQVSDGLFIGLAQQIVDYGRAFGVDSAMTKRFFATFSQSSQRNKTELISTLTTRLEGVKQHLSSQMTALTEEENALKGKGEFLAVGKQQNFDTLRQQQKLVTDALAIVNKNISLFRAGVTPLSEESILTALMDSSSTQKRPFLDVANRNPFFKSVLIDWQSDRLVLQLHEDVEALRVQTTTSEINAHQKDKLNQFIINQLAYVTQQSNENASPDGAQFAIALDHLTNSQSFLALNLGAVAQSECREIKHKLEQYWNPQHRDLSRSAFPIWDSATYKTLSAAQKKLGLVVYAPSMEAGAPPSGFRPGSIYVIARGLNHIAQKYRQAPAGAEQQGLISDFDQLRRLLEQEGFLGYSGATYGLSAEYANDFIFELDNYYSTLLKATREDFFVHGTKRFAVLEFTDYEQRLLTLNSIETHMHEDLLKWDDEYRAARVDLNLFAKYDVPAPTRSVFWDNLKLSTKKYFRGDERKVLKWGLDLSGGKTVTIGLRDQNNRPVTDEIDLKQGANELQSRVNKMGVGEVEIRVEGANIVLNFPSAQGFSASDLVKASSMTFHVTNEQFSSNNPALAFAANQFLQEVWNEAVVTNRKDIEGINEIARRHLGQDFEEGSAPYPRSEDAKLLYDSGLRLADPNMSSMSSAYNDTLSAIAMYRGSDFSQWYGQSHPLIVTFYNYALEGSSLDNVHAEYDPSKGNILVFSVKGSNKASDGSAINPRADFYLWTSQFSQEKITGTPREHYSSGHGWRMAVVLNGTVISAPVLSSALRDHAMITGHFSQREVNQLAADLKAGSLSFTPKILSEQNVSPELGHVERVRGISAAALGLVLVIIAMVGYYRFGGIVASVAVIFNLLIMWGVLQNINAALTLPGIAGIILTMGMAVDANVLVFERIREEFAATQRLASAIHAGYRKAFSAIVDSNLTTILAAVILMHFDAGPIKAFAITLIIGIVSSMFTALFMTRFYFAGWVQNPNHKELKMASVFQNTNYNFLSKAKMVAIASVIVIVAGVGAFLAQRHSIIGMDFTGGYALTVDLQAQSNLDYRAKAMEGLLDHGATKGDFQIRELNKPNQLRIQLSTSMEQPGRPFAGMPQIEQGNFTYRYQANPRINWVVDSLTSKGLQISPDTLQRLDAHWNAMSGQFSDTTRNHALIGLGLALICILIYITVRFEFKYAISATIALAHDVLITIGVLAILHLLGMPVQIDLQVVGAIMTILGYSLNDTIIIFDRIREDSRLLRKLQYSEMINHALNATLNRTIMTSGTTLVVLIALVALGGSVILNFSLVMLMGVVFGTLSSLYVASPLLLYFHNREVEKQQGAAVLKKS